MALDLTGIENENEFFSQHYMDSVLERDLGGSSAMGSSSVIGTSAMSTSPMSWDKVRSLYARALKEAGADEADDLKSARAALRPIFGNLGYELTPAVRAFGETNLTVWDEARSGDRCMLVVLPVGGPTSQGSLDSEESVDPLRGYPYEPSPDASGDGGFKAAELCAEDALSRVIFAASEPPRFVIVANAHQAVLCERGKWGQKRVLRFDWDAILSRRAPTTLRVLSALLRRDNLAPVQGRSLIDSLDENSHKHAYGVSEDLKYALRESIELLGNEVIWYLREVRREKVYGEGGIDAAELSRECLRVMYRMLFLFYLEARPELGYIPDSGLYQKGYGLELLRDLELRRLSGEESKNGTFFHESITRLFDLIHQGYPASGEAPDLLSGTHIEDGLRIAPLKSHLFDPARTATFGRAKIRNFVWQNIIRLMSLSKPQNRRQRGRISYAQLGINQLGAVYEALLSFQGFFASEDLIEVRQAQSASVAESTEAGEADDGDTGGNADAEGSAFQTNDDPLSSAFFVPAREQSRYKPSEIVVEAGRPKRYPKGTFIYRLAGRDREKSASYYTPEVLTRTLVAYALKELLAGKSASDILTLKVVEPAMGSAAFLNEAVSQLADAYLERAQSETGKRLSQADWPAEKQRVKMYLADNNVFGIDLNPVAVELAEVSLWLGNIFSGAFVPWFGLQLHAGNSLIGARREAGPAGGPYKRIGFEEPGQGEVFHFLVGDAGMADYGDKVVKALEPDAVQSLSRWRKALCKPLDDGEAERLVALSAQIDTLWRDHADMLRKVRAKTTDTLTVWPAPHEQAVIRSTADKDRILERELRSESMKNSSPYRRLKLVLDFWCALWFWPVSKAADAPERELWWSLVELVVYGGVWDVNAKRTQGELFADTMEQGDIDRLRDHAGFVDVDKLIEENPCLQTVRDLAERYRFFHWELEFADVFADHGGFDLVLGNPPWLKVEWNEAGLLSEYDALVAVRKLSAKETNDIREDIFSRNSDARDA
ncbi:MAG TPA: hypothetical protein PKH40_09310, partial [Treponemataceae bacterium]|nr:hypothetical protein [Treponemataceae bacterium]